jgi:two-component system phosphate regulon response regulator PhoB
MKPILVVEDEKDIRDLVEYHLRQAGFSVASAVDGSSALTEAKRQTPSLVILDLMLPGMDGKDVCRALKSNPAMGHIPIIMLTARSEEMDRIIGLELGADDYVTKPFSPKELVLRIKAILRRGERKEEAPKSMTFEDLHIDIDRHQVTVGKRNVELTTTEFKLLVALLANKGRVRTREHLLDKVWGYTYEGYARTVDTHIRRLREKLGKAGKYIETIRGLGYRFKEELEEKDEVET